VAQNIEGVEGMTAEQKQRAAELLAAWRATAYALHGDRMAALQQELVDAPEPEPVAKTTGYYGGHLTISTVDGRVLPFGTALYLAQPAPSVPDGWMRAIDEALVVHHIDIADSSDGYEEAKKKLNELLAINSDIARDCSEPPADVARDAERYRWLREERFDKPYAVTNEHMNAVYEGDDLDKAIDAAIDRQGGE
jgi:hypothetical protein